MPAVLMNILDRYVLASDRWQPWTSSFHHHGFLQTVLCEDDALISLPKALTDRLPEWSDWHPYIAIVVGFGSGLFAGCLVKGYYERKKDVVLETFERATEVKPRKSSAFFSDAIDATWAMVPSMSTITQRPSFLTNQPTGMNFTDLLNTLLIKEEVTDDDLRKLNEAAVTATDTEREAGKQLLQHERGHWHALARTSWRKVAVRIALVGEKGCGKSAIINALRGGLREGDYSYAQENIGIYAQRVLVYRHFEESSKIKYYELPSGNLEMSPDEFFKEAHLDRITFAFIILNEYYTPNMQKMAQFLHKHDKLGGFIRTKVNVYVRNKLEALKGKVTADLLLTQLRETMELAIKNATPEAADDAPLFMFDSHTIRDKMGDFDLQDLKEHMVNITTGEERRVIILAMFKGDQALIKIKYHLLRENIGLRTAFTYLKHDSKFADYIAKNLHLDDISAKHWSDKFHLPLNDVRHTRDRCLHECVETRVTPRGAFYSLLSSVFSAASLIGSQLQGLPGIATSMLFGVCAVLSVMGTLRTKREQLVDLVDMHHDAAQMYLQWLQNKQKKVIAPLPSYVGKSRRASLL